MLEPIESLHETSAEQAIGTTRQTYHERAEEYARTTEDYASYPGLEEEVLAFANASIDGFPLLDLGCGGGRDSRALASLGKSVVAGDICAAMLDCARRHPALAKEGAIFYACANALSLPFRDDVFGGIWASASMLHLPSSVMPQALSEIMRTLTPGGQAVISMRVGTSEGWRDDGSLEGRRWFTFVLPDVFANNLRLLGFTDVTVRFTGRRGWFVAVGRKSPE